MFALLLLGASALVPGFTTTTTPSRREVFEQAAGVLGASLIAPKPALADGAVSQATVARSKGIYGARIAALKGAVDKGDFDAVVDEKLAFELFNSGAYMLKSPTSKEKKAASVAATNEILAACEAKDKSKLKSAYDAFMKNAAIDTSAIDVTAGQGISSDYDWKQRTAKGSIYQR
ncbi:hypothetical protein CTAYLR_002546 [Chrysophaeum taylorii]|uniref:Photosystem II Psb31 protein domain-containing protein n=1 Tax=Chrysophaeum taylorii TaxID=2483200 RepID=A0AAD7XJD6_9STRA|nr:hypothetical protein CTAYLR_002546 [Chrysophaeum taylorii]